MTLAEIFDELDEYESAESLPVSSVDGRSQCGFHFPDQTFIQPGWLTIRRGDLGLAKLKHDHNSVYLSYYPMDKLSAMITIPIPKSLDQWRALLFGLGLRDRY